MLEHVCKYSLVFNEYCSIFKVLVSCAYIYVEFQVNMKTKLLLV